MNRDTVVGVVGAAVLVAAMVGIFWYEGARSEVAGAVRFDVASWGTASANGPQASGTLQEGASTDESVNVTQQGLARIEFVLTWNDAIGSGDTFRVRVVSPTGEAVPGEGTNSGGPAGEIRVAFADLNPAPTATTAVGSDEADAKRRLVESDTMNGGVGIWLVTIELVTAGDQVTPAGGVVVTADNEQAWTLQTVYHVHDPTFQSA